MRIRHLPGPRGALALAALVALGTSCGPVLPPQPVDAGRPCVQDAECVPDDCCGRGRDAVHLEDAPDCSAVRCDGSCPSSQLRCGCAIPLCRDGRCAVAVSVMPGCP